MLVHSFSRDFSGRPLFIGRMTLNMILLKLWILRYKIYHNNFNFNLGFRNSSNTSFCVCVFNLSTFNFFNVKIGLNQGWIINPFHL